MNSDDDIEMAPEPPPAKTVDSDFVGVVQNPYGDWLRSALENKKMKVWELAEASGISSPQIYNIVAGRSLNPQQKTRQKIEAVLGRPPANEVEEEEATAEVPGAAINVRMGDLTDFDPHDEALLPDVPGIYVFYDITERPVYVGRASAEHRTIAIRVREHYEKFWFKRPIVNNGAYIQIDDPGLCQAVERALIKFLKSNAVLNKQHVERA